MFTIFKSYLNIYIKNPFFILAMIFSLNLLSINSIFVSLAEASPVQQLDKIVAVVGDEIITLSELESKLEIISKSLKQQNITLPSRKILTKQVLDKLILNSIQLQLAKQTGIEVDSTSVNQTIFNLAQRENLTVNQFKQQLLAQGISFEDFREQVKKDKIISKLHEREIIHDIKVSNADIEGYINSPVGQDNSGIEYRVGHILISGPDTYTVADMKKINQKIDNIMQNLKQGKDFKEVAASYSEGTEALNGGDLGWRKLNQIPSILVKQVMSMEIGEISKPIQARNGYHIIKLQDRRSNSKESCLELRAKQILIKSKDNVSDVEIKESLEKLKKSILDEKQDFAKLAAKKSEESITAANGGDLGWFNEKQVLPEFWKQLYKLKLGEVSLPFKTDLGWHLVKLEGRRDASKLKDGMRNQIIEILREQKFHEMLEVWLSKIRNEAQVKILL